MILRVRALLRGFLAIRPPGGVTSSVTCRLHAPSLRLARRTVCQETARSFSTIFGFPATEIRATSFFCDALL